MRVTGFSGATGGITSTQYIQDFQFTPIPIISMQRVNNAANLSWPAIGGCVLQSNSELSTADWQTVSDPVTVTNATFQMNTLLQGIKFYRLKISNP